jgi:4-hydroxy-3-methylbut-2-enyl diphosphate reductase
MDPLQFGTIPAFDEESASPPKSPAGAGKRTADGEQSPPGGGTPAPHPRLALLTPTRMDAGWLRRGVVENAATVVRTGIGPKRARRAVQEGEFPIDAIAVAGVGWALSTRVRPGDVVVADHVRTDALTEGVVPPTRLLPGAVGLAALLRKRGLTVHVGTIISTDNRVNDQVRDRLAMTHALIADRESAWLLASGGTKSIACVRVATHHTALEFRRRVRTLRAIAAALTEWAPSRTT